MAVNFLDIKLAGQQVCQVSPWPYIVPIPDIDASHITQIGTLEFRLIGFKISDRQAIAFI
jgi:hypothetical protein